MSSVLRQLMFCACFLSMSSTFQFVHGAEPGGGEDKDGSSKDAGDEYLRQDYQAPRAYGVKDVVLYEIVLSTRDQSNAETDDNIYLEVYSAGRRIERFNLDTPGHNDRERGHTDSHSKIPSSNVSEDDIEYFRLITDGEDAWLPSGVVISTKNRSSGIVTQFAAVPWSLPTNEKWVSTDTSDANGHAWPIYRLPVSRDKSQADKVEKYKADDDDK
jgi:hypothetical protein